MPIRLSGCCEGVKHEGADTRYRTFKSPDGHTTCCAQASSRPAARYANSPALGIRRSRATVKRRWRYSPTRVQGTPSEAAGKFVTRRKVARSSRATPGQVRQWQV